MGGIDGWRRTRGGGVGEGEMDGPVGWGCLSAPSRGGSLSWTAARPMKKEAKPRLIQDNNNHNNNNNNNNNNN